MTANIEVIGIRINGETFASQAADFFEDNYFECNIFEESREKELRVKFRDKKCFK